jgi:DNA-directed RNA polymerase specialized sigma24 family protein
VKLRAAGADTLPGWPIRLGDTSGKMRVAGRLVPLMRTAHDTQERQIASAGFARLLARLGGDPDGAAEYERLRLTLERFFDWNGASTPDECADEVLDRLARKLEADVVIENIRAFALGVARLVLLEWRRRPVSLSLDDRPEAAAVSASPAQESDADAALRNCFDRCLAGLPAESRTVVLEYYVAERRAKIDNRRRLARMFGISESALRNRVQRVRDRLERCVHRCAGCERSGR